MPGRFVNAYDVNRAFGGPEEGGWWFDVGVLLESVTLLPGQDAAWVRERLTEKHAPQFEGNHEIGSVLCEGQLAVYEEDEPGANFPTEYPHYE